MLLDLYPLLNEAPPVPRPARHSVLKNRELRELVRPRPRELVRPRPQILWTESRSTQLASVAVATSLTTHTVLTVTASATVSASHVTRTRHSPTAGVALTTTPLLPAHLHAQIAADDDLFAAL